MGRGGRGNSHSPPTLFDQFKKYVNNYQINCKLDFRI